VQIKSADILSEAKKGISIQKKIKQKAEEIRMF